MSGLVLLAIILSFSMASFLWGIAMTALSVIYGGDWITATFESIFPTEGQSYE
jgi:hypothetical protein